MTESASAPITFEAFCVKCRKKVITTNGRLVEAKNGKPMQIGECPDCGTKLTRFGAPKPAAQA